MNVSYSVNTADLANPNAVSSLASTSSDLAVQRGAITTEPGDQTTIRASSGLLSSALDESDVRMERVAALWSAIQAGTYQVPASAVADKMLTAMGG